MSTPDITLTIAGADKTSLLQVSTLNIEDEINANNTASFTLIDETDAYIPFEGAEVVITDGATTIFAGTIHDPETEDLSEGGNDAILTKCACVDFNEIPGRRLIQENFNTPGQTLGDIASYIVATYLAADGVTDTYVEDGPTLDPVAFTLENTAADAFNRLADLTGYVWWVDYDKALHFASRESTGAAFSISDDPPSGNFRKFRARRSRAQYRNRQFVQGGFEKTNELTERFVGDGETQTFTLKFAVGETVSEVTVGANVYTGSDIGIRGIDDEDVEWCYKVGENTVTLGEGGTVPDEGEVVSVTYIGQDQVMVRIQDDSKIADRQAIEGGSGVYEAFEVNESINDGDQADAVAVALIRKYGLIPTMVNYETDTAGLRAGQTQLIQNGRHGVSGQFLITKVTYNDEENVILRYQVEAYDTDKMPDWQVFWAQLNRQGKRAQSQDNQTVRFGQFVNDVLVMSDLLTPTMNTYADAVVDVASVGEDEVC